MQFRNVACMCPQTSISHLDCDKMWPSSQRNVSRVSAFEERSTMGTKSKFSDRHTHGETQPLCLTAQLQSSYCLSWARICANKQFETCCILTKRSAKRPRLGIRGQGLQVVRSAGGRVRTSHSLPGLQAEMKVASKFARSLTCAGDPKPLATLKAAVKLQFLKCHFHVNTHV